MAGRSEGLPLEPLWSAVASPSPEADTRGGPLPPALAERYPGNLTIDLQPDRPTIVANFVSSLDGVAALGKGEASSGGGEISGFSEADRYMMALLRGLADVVVLGAGTMRVGRRHVWTAAHLQPKLADAFAAWRSELGLTPHPTTIVVTASGNLNATHAAFNATDVPVILVTTKAGAELLAALPFSPNVRIEAVGEGALVPAEALVEIIRATGARLALCEGGPHLFGEILQARLVDELFLTLAPQVIGGDAAELRLGLAAGARLDAGHGRWTTLRSIRRAGDDLFLRYRFEPSTRA
jgi:riboflavin biosynthesis pyrimidine reductase